MARLPSKDEIQALPKWARVAFAARCARRVLPLYIAHLPKLTGQDFERVKLAIKVSERTAATDVRPEDVSASNQEHNAPAYIFNVTNGISPASDVAEAIVGALITARAANDSDADRTNTSALKAATSALTAVSETDHADLVLRAMSFDFVLLQVMASKEDWTDDTPVPPEFFGPLWPEGEPKDWPKPESESEPTAIQLEFTIPDGVDKDKADQLIGEVILAANELHHAFGGSGLTIADDIKVYEASHTPEPEPAGGPA